MEIPEERIWILLSRKLSDSITEPEEAELKQLLRHHPDAQYTFEILGKIWRPSADPSLAQEGLFFNDPDEDKQTVTGEENREGKRAGKIGSLRRGAVLYYAAALLLLAAFVYVLRPFPEDSKMDSGELYTISTKPGEKKKIFLPDSTEVWLNACSRLQYGAHFKSDSVRTLTFTGEAYFKVKHDAGHPFVIRTKNMEIRDIGTEFNVKSYSDEALAEATLISGMIEVSLYASARKIRLRPNEKIVVYQNKHVEKYGSKDSMKKEAPVQDIQISGYRVSPIEKDPVIETFSETAWMQNDLVFKNEPFNELAKAMERKYAVKIVITDSHIGQYQLTGIFRDETVEQALAELQVIAPFDYNIRDSVITIFNK